MAEHWCKDHKTVWFKKGKMKGYAHPILDDDGGETGQWCNESEETTEKAPERTQRGASTDDSIELQVIYKGAPELEEAIKKNPNSQFLLSVRNWATSKLSKWASMGEVKEYESETKGFLGDKESKEISALPMVQLGQIERIKRAAQRYKDNTEAYLKVMKDAYQMTDYKKLNQLQAEDFIKRLESGEGLKAEEKEPEDIPFRNKGGAKT